MLLAKLLFQPSLSCYCGNIYAADLGARSTHMHRQSQGLRGQLEACLLSARIWYAGSFGIAFNNGGPVAAVWGWFWVAIMTMTVVRSLSLKSSRAESDKLMPRCLQSAQGLSWLLLTLVRMDCLSMNLS